MLTPEQAEQATKLITAGKKTKQIIAEMQGVKVADIYYLKSKLKKAGQVKDHPARTSDVKKKKTISKLAGKGEGFQAEVAKEIERLENDIERLDKLIKAYDKTNSDFVAHCEKRRDQQKAMLESLRAYQQS